MKFNVRVDLNEPKITNKVTNDNLGMFAAQSWKKHIGAYTPRGTGQMEDTAIIEPWTITYSATSPNGYHYPRRVYYDDTLNFQKIHNPFATDHWDKKAEQAGQKGKLYTDINAYLHR